MNPDGATSFVDRIPDYHARLHAALERWLPAADHYPATLHEAMRYAAEGGKRLRALLIYAAGEALSVAPSTLDGAACAVELIHAYSLVHDDLPAMDDDELRRGRPTVHKAYDEATAIITGDALQALAFHVLAHDDRGPEARARLHMVDLLAEAAGSRGMCGGQAVDLAAVGSRMNLAELEAMHIHKTGALIRACLLMACQARTALDARVLDGLDRYGKCIGLAFQIQDDVLDVEGDSETLGKTGGKDHASNKPTFPALLGLSVSSQRAAELFVEAHAALAPLSDAALPLHQLADHIAQRAR